LFEGNIYLSFFITTRKTEISKGVASLRDIIARGFARRWWTRKDYHLKLFTRGYLIP